MKKCKLLLFDLDGTLLQSDKTISTRTLSALKKCRGNDILIGVSTSRSEQNSLVLGRWIVETQQMGEKRAKYGSKVIKTLSEKLQKEFGKGFSEDTLKNARKFYLTYKERISETVFSLFAIEKSETVFSLFEKEPPFIVSWSHYLQLMRIENEAERSFYEIESAKTGWGVRTLQRQYNSSLYERLALSRDKEGVLRLATEGNVIAKPEDIIKQPTCC